MPAEAAKNAKQEYVGWGESSTGWLRTVDEEESRAEEDAIAGVVDSVGSEQENGTQMKRIEF